jgi:anti-anti-sigma factor
MFPGEEEGMHRGQEDGVPVGINTGSLDNKEELTYLKEYDGDRCKLTLVGELKHENSDSLYRFSKEIFESGSNDLVIDFRKLEYVDTAGLQSLVRVYKHVASSENLSFIVLAREGELMDILRTCRFDKFINITLDPAAADGVWTGNSG